MELLKLAHRGGQSNRAVQASICLAMMAIAGVSVTAAQTVIEGPPAPLTAQEQHLLVSALGEASDHGLAVSELSSLRAALDNPAEDIRAPARERLAIVFLRYAVAMRGGRIVPSEVNRNWGLRPAPFDAAAELEAARTGGDLQDWIADLAPSQDGYALLVTAAHHYQSIVASGGWARIDGGHALHEGDQGVGVSGLRTRLGLEGYNTLESTEAETFDAPLAAALTAFQAAHALEADGVLSEATRVALNVTAEARLAQIFVNQERWRWLPRSMPPSRIEVDVAGAELNLIANNQSSLTARVIVGRDRLPTPLFQAEIDEVVFNPAWNVPTSIASHEILPAAARDPTYLQRHGYALTQGRVVQAPGAGNALGQIKFGSPNPYGVYLHDTPSRSLFARLDRRLSHGCMRVQAPRALAAAVLASQAWTPVSVDEAVDAGRTQRVRLTEPLPLFVVYRTVQVTAAGRVQFQPDGYGWDAQLQAALARSEIAPSHAPTWAPPIT